MKRHTLSICSALLLAAAACNKSEIPGDATSPRQTPVIIQATGLYDLQPAPASRATVDGDWQGVTSVALRIGNAVKEYTVTASDADGYRSATLSRENDPFWWKNSNDITVSAWWPLDDADITQMPDVVVLEDQSEWADFAASDFISAENQTVNYGAPTLHFTHRTALVHIVLTDYTEGLESVRLTGLSTEGGNPGIIIPYDKGNHTYSALVLPQEVKAGMAFIACTFDGGKTFGYRMQESVEWTAGEEYTYTVSLAAAEGPGYTYDDATHTYIVHSAKGLLAWNEAALNDLSLNCILDADITLPEVADEESNWTPIGYFDDKNRRIVGYTGIFDGGGHTITGLTINLPNQDYVGLFGCLSSNSSSIVQNLTLAEVNINGSNYVGGVAGYDFSFALTGCTVLGNVTGTGDYVGGVVGCDSNGHLTDCTVMGNVTGTGDYVGGVAGESNNCQLTACYVAGKVFGGSHVGGVTGYNSDYSVTGCSVLSEVTGTGDYVGGVVGVSNSNLTACYATGNVTGTGYVGGVVGYNHGTVTGCHATGDVSGPYYVGGVAGFNDTYGTVTGCYWSDYDGNGIGGGNGEATKVDGTTVTWVDAQRGMNEAIDAWNENNPNKQCNWHYAGATETTPPTLAENK